MANKSVFASVMGNLLPRPDAVNSEGAPAYALSPRQKLAQLAATGCANRTFYAEAREQVADIIATAQELDAEYIARVALYAREQGYMKDMPALLCALLTTKDLTLATIVFNRVIKNGRMLRTFVQMMRSGVVGRKSLGSAPKRLIRNWLNEASDEVIITAMVGNDPSLADIIKMVHPKPKSKAREALFAYVIGKPCDVTLLPQSIRDFIAFKADQSAKVPDVPFQMLTSLKLTPAHWVEIVKNAKWHMLRMNLNTFHRNRLFESDEVTAYVAARLADRDAIKRAKVFPYQLLAAYLASSDGVPMEIKYALQDALETAVSNIPHIEGRVAVAVDVSGSMHSPVTGWRKGSTSKVQCIDVAALIGASILRKNPDAKVVPFDLKVHSSKVNARDSIMTNAERLRRLGGGGTDCSLPIHYLSKKWKVPDLVIMVSDNESWIDNRRANDTGVMRAWQKLKGTNPKAKLVCLDFTPNSHTQAFERDDILNIGGFSDNVFKIIAAFAKDELNAEHWVGEIEMMEI